MQRLAMTEAVSLAGLRTTNTYGVTFTVHEYGHNQMI
jgi:hypothetical protein